MKEIELTQGKVALVDDEDYEWLSQRKWHYAHGYARSNGYNKVYMHRIIINPPLGMDTDHINCNKLDNRRANLRSCTRSQNQRNIPILKSNKSGRKGVSWHNTARKWEACIRFGGKKIYLGVYDDIELASKVHDDKCKELFGEFVYKD